MSHEHVPAILKVEGLTRRFPGVVALDQVSFDLRAGEVHGLCGENGAGKSTLIKILSGAWPHGTFEGRIEINGSDARFHGIHDAERAGIAVIYQELALVPQMTVAENIHLGNEPTRFGRIDWNRIYSQTEELLGRFELDLNPGAMVGDLGVGQQQLVEIVKALAKNSRILLLDEPTAALTESEVNILLKIVDGLRKNRIACIYISHKLGEILRVADRVTVLRDGRSVVTTDSSETNRDELIRHMVGRRIKDFFPRQAGEPADVLLRLSDLTVTDPFRGNFRGHFRGRGRFRGGRPVLQDISFELRAGEVLGLGGLMGSGRTELLMHLFGAFGERRSGQVRLKGREIHARSPSEAIERGLMLVSEDRKRFGLVMPQTIAFNMSLATLPHLQSRGIIDQNAEFKRNHELFGTLGVKAPSLEQIVYNLSGGNQQKVVLGKALMTEPSVILLDEPTRGIDVGAKVEVYQLINRLTASGKAVLLVSSELPELMGMSDRMIILSDGRIGGAFTRDEATQEKILAAAMAHHEKVA